MSAPPVSSPSIPTPDPKRRPTSATVFAILNFIFGGLGVCGTIWAIVGLLVPDVMSFGQPNPIMDAITDDATMTSMTWIGNGLGILGVILLLAGGAGLWAIKPFGRICSILYAILALVSIVFQACVHFIVQAPLLENAVAKMQADPNADAQQLEVLEITVNFTGVLTIVILVMSAIYPVFLLIFMNRRPILERYKPGYMAEQEFKSPQQKSLPSDYTPPDQSNPYSSPFDPKQ